VTGRDLTESNIALLPEHQITTTKAVSGYFF